MKVRVIVPAGSGPADSRLEFDDIAPSFTVLELKERVSRAASGLAAEEQRAIYRGHILGNERTMEEISFQDGDTVHIVRWPHRDPAPSSATVPVASVPPQSPFAGIPGADPEILHMAMNNPLIQQIMSDPETLRALLFANPQMRDFVDQNPEIGHILSDPSMLRQTMETARNPELMREMVRNTDRAMSNIEAHPEGFNALRRMYNNVQEPLNQVVVADESAEAPAAEQQASEQQREAPNRAVLPNPWAAPPTGVPVTPRLPPGLDGTGAASGHLGALGGLEMMAGNANGPPRTGSIQAGGESAAAGHIREQQGQQSYLNAVLHNPELMQSMMEAMQDAQVRRVIFGDSSGVGSQGVNGSPTGAPASDVHAPHSNQQELRRMLMHRLVLQPPQMPLDTGEGASVIPAAPSHPGQRTVAPGVDMEASRRAAEGRYAAEMQTILDMGFDDPARILDALMATGGNVNAAIGRLLG